MNTFLCFIAAVVTTFACIGFYGAYVSVTNDKYEVPKVPFFVSLGVIILLFWCLFVIVTT